MSQYARLVVMTKKLLSVLFGLVAFNVLFFASSGQFTSSLPVLQPGTLGFFFFMVAAHAIIMLAFWHREQSRKFQFATVSSIVAVGASLLALWRANWVDQVLLGGAALYASFISLYLLSLSHHMFGGATEFIFAPLQVVLSWFGSASQVFGRFPETVGNFFSTIEKQIPKPNIQEHQSEGLLRGAVVSVPVLLVLFALLASADPIFAQSIAKLFSFTFVWPQLSEALLSRTIFSGLFLIGLVPLVRMLIHDRYRSPFQASWLKMSRSEALTLTTSVALLLAVFLVVQYRYLFTGVSVFELNKFGILTYSDYVRRGFKELVLVAAIVYMVAGFAMVVERSLTEHASKALKYANTVLLLESLVFIGSIFRRVWLYQTFHGLSRVRVYGLAFLVGVGILTGFLLLRHYFKHVRQWYLMEVLSIFLVFALVFWLNTDRLIAQRYKPTVNNQVDYTYIARLSPDAVDGWIEAFQWAKTVLDSTPARELSQLSDDETRQLVYSTQVLQSLVDHEQYLKGQYNEGKLPVDRVFSLRAKQYNFAEEAAFYHFRAAVSEAELHKYYELSRVFLSTGSARSRTIQLDRSRLTPLLD